MPTNVSALVKPSTWATSDQLLQVLQALQAQSFSPQDFDQIATVLLPRLEAILPTGQSNPFAVAVHQATRQVVDACGPSATKEEAQAAMRVYLDTLEYLVQKANLADFALTSGAIIFLLGPQSSY